MATSAGFWGPEGYSLLVNKNPRRGRIRRTMNRRGFDQVTALFNSLIGATSGSGTGAITYKQVEGQTPFTDGGGVRTIETVTAINRNTTAADVAMLKEMTVGVVTAPSPYPTDAAGINGGTTV